MSRKNSKTDASFPKKSPSTVSKSPDNAVTKKGSEGKAPSGSPRHSLFSRILAFGGIAIILALYIATLFFAIFDRSETMSLFLASVVCTIVVPVLLYVYNWIYQLLKKDRQDKAKEAEEDAKSIKEKAMMESQTDP